MRSFLQLTSLCPLLTILYLTAYSQQPDSILYRQGLDNMLDSYKKGIGENSLLYNGSEYLRNGRKAKGFPFWESDDPLKGSVQYNGTDFKNVDMRYDLVLDRLVVSAYNNAAIALVNEKVERFSILGHLFIRITPEKSAGSLKTGFYEQLYEGKLSVIGRHEKRLLFPSNVDEEPRYASFDLYYLKKDQTYFIVDSKDGLLDVLKDRKDQLKKYIKSEKINFKKHLEEALIKTVTYYDQIKT